METATPEFAFEYRVTEQDFVHGFMTHFRNTGPVRRVLYYPYPLLGAICILLAVLLAVMQARAGEDWNGPVPLFLLGVAWLACYFYRPFALKRLYRKDERYKSPINVRIAGNDVYVTTKQGEGHQKPGSYVRAFETNELVLLYTSPLMLSIVPKRDLTSEQLNGLHAFLDRELPIQKGRNRLPAKAVV